MFLQRRLRQTKLVPGLNAVPRSVLYGVSDIVKQKRVNQFGQTVNQARLLTVPRVFYSRA